MISRVFIERPIFAWVLAIIVMLSGIGSIFFLPRAQYPDIAPVQVTVRATYPGASAQTVENSVTQVLEQTLTGIDGLLYFGSTSSSRGQVLITVTFEKGVDPDIAQVQVQNQVQQAVSRLPAQVQQQGLVVRKSNPDEILVVSAFDETNRMTSRDIADYLTSNLQDPLSRVNGVGSTNVQGAPYAMRIWLDPAKLTAFQLMPSDVIAAIRAQNAEVSAGEVGGQPQPADKALNAIITSQSRLQTPEEFGNVVLKTTSNGAVVRILDVARVELGAENYNMTTRVNGHPGAGITFQLAPGADALATVRLLRTEVEKHVARFPPGLKLIYANDMSPFIQLSIDEVVETLIEAVFLVVIVMFVFLQSWRATLIPAIAVPVVILGTFAILYLAGYSINTMTLFGLVLAIGLLVDDAIVVVENVERLMEENPEMSPRKATIASMREINVALIAIALVLSAVFMPMALFGGSTGVIYRQFSVTIISAMALSVLVALVLSPALAASLLKSPHDAHSRETWLTKRFPRAARQIARSADRFKLGEAWTTRAYLKGVKTIIARRWVFAGLYLILCAGLCGLFLRLPTGFLPDEDMGRAIIQFRLPSGAMQSRTLEVGARIENYLRSQERDTVSTMLLFIGAGGENGGQNNGAAYLNLTDWDARKLPSQKVEAIVERAKRGLADIRDAEIFPLAPPSVRGLGQAGGFTMELMNETGMSAREFEAARDRLLRMAQADPELTAVRLSQLPNVAQLRLKADPVMLSSLGLTQDDVNATESTAFGGAYVNDFIDRGRVKRVYVQGDAQFRDSPEKIGQWFVRGASGQMAPFSSFSSMSWSQAPTSLQRFNGLPSAEFQGSGAPGVSSGEAMARMEQLAARIPGVGVEWSGLSFQERLSGGQAPILYGLSLVVVFLCLAALYESWSIPISVILVIPLGLIGAVVAVSLRGLVNDIYLQIGLLMTMGLAAKNAILIVEFAEQAENGGKTPLEAALEAARLRLRPIMMTSFAFIFGVLPLAIASGVGANSRIAIGTAVVGGMITATVLATFYIPMFFVLVRLAAIAVGRWTGRGAAELEAAR